MYQPKVSIIIPVYNASQYLDRCRQSIISQTYKNLEVIFVNDGSTDNSGEIIDEIAASSPNVLALHQENQGPAIARRTGVLKASGDYVMFLDSDDSLPHDSVEYMVNTSLSENLDAFYGLFNRVIDGNVKTIAPRDFEGVIGGDDMLENVLDPTFMYHAAICFSKRDFWDADMFCEDRDLPNEDVLTNVKLSIKCSRIGVYNKPVYNYHLVGSSLTMTGKYFKVPFFKKLFKLLYSILRENGKEELTKDKVRMMEVFSLGFLIEDIDTSDEWYKQVMSYDVSRYPRKIKVLHMLLHCPWLLHLCVKGNRWIKRLLGKQR